MFRQTPRVALKLRILPPTVYRNVPPRIRAISSSTPKYSSVTGIQTNEAYAPFAHYSQAIKAAGQVWLSGQIPADAQGNIIQGSVVEKTKAIIKNTESILKALGTGLDKVVKVVVSLNLEALGMSLDFSLLFLYSSGDGKINDSNPGE